ncbi:helicase [Xylanimonas allomyrinae]|uniref:Helicase n=1 Tax=Xylanimonas allomyrinae TaxID=2509459 RepID=A0A4P6ELK1_9MICO|nr:helicase-related protein [Xylanimonas allomyrinae]QAY63512.1 helicase [Xylanimonas allomyrinae]
MTDLTPWYTARDQMVDAVRADLYGGADDEVLGEEPLERFIVGILYPQASVGVDAEIQDANEVPEAEQGAAPDAEYDPGVSFAHLRYPSTIGLTFGVSESTTSVRVLVAADRYEPDEPTGTADDPEGPETRARTRRVRRWRRIAAAPEPVVVDLTQGSPEPRTLVEGLELRVVVRPVRDGVINVTLVLVNGRRRPAKGRVDDLCWFRPELTIQAVDGEFKDRRPDRVLAHLDADERGGELLYRRERHLAVGHGVAVTWDEGARVDELRTTFFPQHDLALAKADRTDVPGLSMPSLAEAADVAALTAPLLGLVETYEGWIAEQDGRAHAEGLPAHHRETAEKHVADARRAAGRMRAGIALLERDPVSRRSFQMMNAVMQQQRSRQEFVRNGATDVVGSWRPFQIAFILLNLEGLVDPTAEDRDVADLLWFPTGGGKTEAYLGLIAFTLIHRRLRGDGDDGRGAGVGVIMRYTLRLLTLQQFERAAGLICALENLRATDAALARSAPFTVGLWVGQGATPNTVDAAARALRKLANHEDPGDLGNPVQLLRCPWCGTRLTNANYDAKIREPRMYVRCPNVECRFHRGDGLPVCLVDEDVYDQRPSLIIGTVDKFAMLAWSEKGGRLFGRGATASSDATPDLIVQDELHLISGPLGTLVGLYETAIDFLATDPDTHARPKLIASTATIRRAGDQVGAVFDRRSQQFPPPGIDAGDSFFAVDALPEEKGTRRYVGLMAPSTSHATLLVRTYAALLQGAHDLDADDSVKDAYWTLLGYFNSLRVLGAAYIQTSDDVRDRVKVVAGRLGTPMRHIREPAELTSRKRSSEIPEQLERLQTSLPHPDTPDVVLATNMISVGVDVDRLGLMAVMGQPQTTSEYIQSTSRVGRRYPGLVFTLFNASRSRDLSHFESFTSYHRALYKQVEATGATPFAPRALDRGLHGLMTILARHTTAGAAADGSVGVPVDSDAFDGIARIIAERADRVAGSATAGDVERALDELTEAWASSWDDGVLATYASWRGAGDKALMVPAGSPPRDGAGGALAEAFPPGETPWPTLTSLRNVDRESTLRIIRRTRTKTGSPDVDD